MSGTNWHTFAAGDTISALKFNENFDWIEESVLPQVGGTLRHNQDDFGTQINSWRNGFFATGFQLAGTMITGPVDNQSIALSNGIMHIKSQGVRGDSANYGALVYEMASETAAYPDFRDEASKQIATSELGSLATGTTITSVAITTLGGKVLLEAHASVKINGNPTDVEVSIDRAGTAVTGGRQRYRIAGLVAAHTDEFPFAFHCIDTPTAGSYTYNLRYTINVGSLTAISFYNLSAIEVRK